MSLHAWVYFMHTCVTESLGKQALLLPSTVRSSHQVGFLQAFNMHLCYVCMPADSTGGGAVKPGPASGAGDAIQFGSFPQGGAANSAPKEQQQPSSGNKTVQEVAVSEVLRLSRFASDATAAAKRRVDAICLLVNFVQCLLLIAVIRGRRVGCYFCLASHLVL